MTDPRTAGLRNRSAQRIANQGARLAILERRPPSTVVIGGGTAVLPIGSGTELTQEDVTAIGVKQVGTDDAQLRILPSAGSQAALQLFDGPTEVWKTYKHTDNAWKLQDVIGSNLGSFTVTIASPAVFTTIRTTTGLLTHGLTAGTPVKFTTTGALPTGVTAGTTYYVIAAGLTAYSFEVSATLGGSAVNTSGTQSGTHTLYKLSATDIMSAGSADPDGGGIYVDRRMTLRGSRGAPNLFANKTFDAGSSPRCLIFAWPNAFSGTWHNGARGDQLYNDSTNGPIFTSGNIYQTQIPTIWNRCGTLQGFCADLQADEVEGPVTITAVEGTGGDVGKIIRVAAGHGYQTSPTVDAGECSAPSIAVVTITGFTGGLTGLNSTWRAEIIDAQTFRIPSTSNTTNSASPSGTLRCQRHLYKDTEAFHMRMETNSPGGNLTNEWNVNVNAGAWSKAVGLNILARDQNTYLSYKTLTNGPNQVFQANLSRWPDSGLIGAGIFSVPTSPQGQPGTALMLGASAGATDWKRLIVAADGLANNTPANEKFCLEPGDAYGVRMGIGNYATVNQTFNTSGLDCRLVIAPIADPTANTDGIQFGNSATAVRLFRAGASLLKVADKSGGAGAFWATGNVTVGSPSTSGNLTLYSDDGSGHIYFTEQSAAPSGIANTAKLYADDDGTGKTRARWRVGATEIYTVAQEGGLPSWAVGNMTATGSGSAGNVGIYMTNTGQMDCLRASGSWMRNFLAAADANPVARFVATGEYQVGAGGASAADVGFHRVNAGELTITGGSSGSTGVLRAATLGIAGTAGAGYLQYIGQSAAPAAMSGASVRVRTYLKAGKLVHMYWDGTNHHYNILTLTTGAWTYQLNGTAP